MKFWCYAASGIRALFREVSAKLQIWAQAAAGLTNLAVVVFIICIVAEPRWAKPEQQLQILMYLGIIAALTNAVVVVALSRVNLSAKGPGGTQFEVDAGADDKPTATAVAVATAGGQ